MLLQTQRIATLLLLLTMGTLRNQVDSLPKPKPSLDRQYFVKKSQHKAALDFGARIRGGASQVHAAAAQAVPATRGGDLTRATLGPILEP